MFRHTLIAAALAVAYSGVALAAVTAEEAKQLGTTLTPIGAEKAGNKDGTIPEWTGGLTTPPAGFVKGSGVRPDPYAADKPRLTIDAKNMAQHADKLTVGTQELLKRNPTTYRLDVYPTRRPVTYPKRIVDNTRTDRGPAHRRPLSRPPFVVSEPTEVPRRSPIRPFGSESSSLGRRRADGDGAAHHGPWKAETAPRGGSAPLR